MADRSTHENRERRKPAGVVIRPAGPEDFKGIHELLQDVGYEVGLHILTIYFTTSEAKWQVAINDKGEMVAFDSIHKLPVFDTSMGYNMYVRDDYRGRGIITAFGSIDKYGSGMGNSTAQSMIQMPFLTFDMKLLGFSGLITKHLPYDCGDSNLSIGSVNGDLDLDQLIVYDRRVLDIDRAKFLRRWSASCDLPEAYCRTLLAKREGRVVGYGTVRRFSNYYALMPMYADDARVAEALFLQCHLLLKPGENFYVYFPATNSLMMQLVHRLKLSFSDSETRNYNNEAIHVKDLVCMDRVFAMHEYWPV